VTVKKLPKLSLAVDSATHLILAATASTGSGGDQPFWHDLLYHAWRRCGHVKRVVADAGYDSEENFHFAKFDLSITALVPPRAGRPTDQLPRDPLRRQMHITFAKGKHKPAYGQRWQSETVNSMIKRNLGSALRARSTVSRRHELLLRVLTHNIMILAQG